MKTSSIYILGLAGGIGGAVAESLIGHGLHLRALVRDPAALPEKWSRNGAVALIRGDAMDPADVVGAADGCSAIFHGVNPAGYRDWGKLVLPMIDNTIAAATANRARIVLPGTIYNTTRHRPQPSTRTVRRMRGPIRGISAASLKTRSRRQL